MTEAEWLACEDPNGMYDFLREQRGVSRRKAGKRKVRLFGCASCRLFGDALSDPRSVAAVEYMERFADGEADPAEMAAVEEQARLALLEAIRRPAPADLRGRENPARRAAEAAFNVVGAGGGYAHVAMRSSVDAAYTAAHHEWLGQRRALARLLRCVFGNPFHPITLTSVCRMPTIVSLARAVYDERQLPSGELDSHRLSVLADALEEYGAPGELAAHLRSPGPHVRGCWPIDLCLGLS